MYEVRERLENPLKTEKLNKREIEKVWAKGKRNDVGEETILMTASCGISL